MSQTKTTSSDAGRLLLIEDEDVVGRMLASQLESVGYRVTLLTDGAAALEQYDVLAPEVVICDYWLPGLDGLQVLGAILKRDPAASVVLLSGNVDVRTTVRALRAGAEDVQTKPVDLDLLRASIDRGLDRSRLIRTHRVATTQVSDSYGFLDDSPPMRRVLRVLENLSQSAVPVLIVGEAGTGKRVVAEMLHQLSPRAGQPFVRVSCAAPSATDQERPFDTQAVRGDDLTEQELLSLAKGGTLFLDEVAELSPALQQLLFTVLTGTGSGPTSNPAVRIVAATERDLAEDVRTGKLRADLYQRLAVLPLAVPSLRSRGPEAIRDLASRMLHAQRFAIGRGPLRLSDNAMALLVSLDWPGNVRQLRNVLEEAFFLALDCEELEAVHLRGVVERSGMGQPVEISSATEQSLQQVERRHIAHILAVTGGHRTDAARILGITRTTLYKKMYEYGLDKVGNE